MENNEKLNYSNNVWTFTNALEQSVTVKYNLSKEENTNLEEQSTLSEREK